MDISTSTDIEQQINAINNPAAQTQPPQAQVESTPEPVQSGQVNTEPQAGQTTADVATTQPATQTEQKSANDVTLETLMREKGTVDPNEIAKSYKEAQRKLTQLAQENAKLRQETTQPPVYEQPVHQPNTLDEVNQRFVQELSENPVMTIAKLVKAISDEQVKPFHETQKEANLNNEIIRLSSSPDTAQTFNLKPVQDEIRKVIEENPNYLDNLPKNLSIVHDIALGRLARKGFTVNAPKTTISQEPVADLGRNKQSQPQTIDTKRASSSELEAYINSLPQ